MLLAVAALLYYLVMWAQNFGDRRNEEVEPLLFLMVPPSPGPRRAPGPPPYQPSAPISVFFLETGSWVVYETSSFVVIDLL